MVVDNRGRTLKFQQSGAGFVLQSPTFAGYQLVATAAGYTLGDLLEKRLFNFDSSGALLSVQDRSGNTHTLTYSDGNLTAVADGLGRVLNLAYDTNHRILSVADGNRVARFTYNGNNLSSFTDVRGNVTDYEYDSATGLPGLMRQKLLPLGNIVTRQAYASSGRVISQTDGLSNVVQFTYGADRSTTQTGPSGNTRKYVFDASGGLASLRDENGKTILYASDDSGRQISSKDSLSYQTQATYDAATGLPLTYLEPDGGKTTYAYALQSQSGIGFPVLT